MNVQEKHKKLAENVIYKFLDDSECISIRGDLLPRIAQLLADFEEALEKENAEKQEKRIQEEVEKRFQNLCHDFQESNIQRFCNGCENYQKEKFGKSPITDLKHYLQQWKNEALAAESYISELFRRTKNDPYLVDTLYYNWVNSKLHRN